MTPLPIKVGSVSGKIYPFKYRGQTYYQLTFYAAGKRVKQSFRTLADAKAAGEIKLAQVGNGEAIASQISVSQAQEFLRCAEKLKPFGVGIEYAVDQFCKRGVLSKMKPTKEIVKELLATKRQDGRDAKYLSTMEYVLGKFAAEFSSDLPSVTTARIDAWLRSMPIGIRTRMGYRGILAVFFKYAKAQRQIPKEWDEMSAIAHERGESKPPSIFTPAELRKLLVTESKPMVRFLALGAFAGLRSAESLRLTWREVGEKYIEVTAKKAKTRQRRLVPILPNLATFLSERGKGVVTGANVVHHTYRHAKERGLTWKQNALRHSFISYRMAVVKNAAQVALECGNSPDIIFRNYRELVTEAAAEDWFSIEAK